MTVGVQEQDERDWIDAYFAGRTGWFLELGAFDGTTNSLTEGLVNAGWNGVMVEADPITFWKLHQRHGENPRLSLVHAVVDEHPGLVQFHRCLDNGQVSTACPEHRAYCETKNQRTYAAPYWTPRVTPEDLLVQFPHSFSFVTIDIEGLSLEVFWRCLHIPSMRSVEVFCVDAPSWRVMPLVGDGWECCYDANQVNTIIKRCTAS